MLLCLKFLYFFQGFAHTHVFELLSKFFMILSYIKEQILANSSIFSRIGLQVFTAIIFFQLIDLGGNITPSFLSILQLSMMLLYTLSSKMNASYHNCTRYSTFAQILFQLSELDLISFKKLVLPLNYITSSLPFSITPAFSSEMIIYSQPDENFYYNSSPKILISLQQTILPLPQAISFHFFIYHIPTTILLSPFGIRSKIYQESIPAIGQTKARDFDGSLTCPSILSLNCLRPSMYILVKTEYINF